jgi:hypothetical protein
MSTTREVRCEATVLVHVRDDAPEDWLSRVTEADFPYRTWGGEPFTEEDGIRMLADNALRNGVDDASRLDGWGDLERGMVELEVIDVEATR